MHPYRRAGGPPRSDREVVLGYDRHQARFNDPLIRCHQAETVDACRGHDGAISRISQSSKRSGLYSDVIGHWKYLKNRIGLQFIEELVQAHPQFDPPVPSEHCDFEQSDGTQRDEFSAPHRAFQRSSLFSREFFRFGSPANRDMGVQQQPRRQMALLFWMVHFPQVRRIEVDDVAHDFGPSREHVRRRLPGFFLGRP